MMPTRIAGAAVMRWISIHTWAAGTSDNCAPAGRPNGGPGDLAHLIAMSRIARIAGATLTPSVPELEAIVPALVSLHQVTGDAP
jgi:hypothetical protein